MDSRKEKLSKKISLYLDRIEELEDDTAEAVLLIDEGEDEYSGELVFPVNLLPEEISEGDYLTLKISASDKVDAESAPEISAADKVDAESAPEINATDKVDAESAPEISATDKVDAESAPEISATDKVDAESAPEISATDKVDAESAPEISATDKVDAENLSARFEEIDAETSDAILTIKENKIYIPANFLPDEISEGATLTLEILRDADKTNAALDEARQLLKELE